MVEITISRINSTGVRYGSGFFLEERSIMKQEKRTVQRGSYEDYDHSDEELYVYDQCCENCRFDQDGKCSRKDKHGREEDVMSDWCPDWKGKRR